MRLAFWRASKDKAPEETPSVAEAAPAVEARAGRLCRSSSGLPRLSPAIWICVRSGRR